MYILKSSNCKNVELYNKNRLVENKVKTANANQCYSLLILKYEIFHLIYHKVADKIIFFTLKEYFKCIIKLCIFKSFF